MKGFQYFKNFKYFDLISIVLVVIIFSQLFSHNWGFVLTDRGRELFLPEEILNGKVPYKDITLIYFPFAYYINAFVYKILGVSINSLLFVSTSVSIAAMLLFYFLSNEFLNKKTSLLLTFLVISVCVFSPNDLFNYIMPYSFGRLYGVIAFWICTYSLIKWFKTNNINYAYISAFSAGFAVSCKLEFLSLVLLIMAGFFLYKSVNFKIIFKCFFLFLFFPVLVMNILILQGVQIQDIFNSIEFGFKFSKTPVMTEFLTLAGLYPLNFPENLNDLSDSIFKIGTVVTACIVAMLFYLKYKVWQIFPFIALFLLLFFYNMYDVARYWFWLPYFLLVFFFIDFKELYKNDKSALILYIAALLALQREFFHLSLNMYAAYSMPLSMLCLFVIFNRHLPKIWANIKMNDLVYLVSLVLIFIYTYNLFALKQKYDYPIYTPKGTVYADFGISLTVNNIIRFINNNVKKDETILILPEGNFINYVTDRKVDLHCFMMDRLYHDAYGEEKAQNVIAATGSDYIILVSGYDVNNFFRSYLYSDSNLSMQYIKTNYTEVSNITDNTNSFVKIFKKNK